MKSVATFNIDHGVSKIKFLIKLCLLNIVKQHKACSITKIVEKTHESPTSPTIREVINFLKFNKILIEVNNPNFSNQLYYIDRKLLLNYIDNTEIYDLFVKYWWYKL